MAFCKSCGAALKHEAKFCSGCGAVVAAAATSTSSVAAIGSSRLPSAALLCIGGLAAIALGVSAWLYTQSIPDYGPSADTNDDGFISLAEVQKKLPDFPKGKRGRWDIEIGILEDNLDAGQVAGAVEEYKKIFRSGTCSENFSHFYQLDVDDTFVEDVQSSRHIIENFAAKREMVKFTRTSTEPGNFEKLARYTVMGKFQEEHADFVFTYGGRDGPKTSGYYEPYLQFRVVATRVGDCSSEGGG
jgi:hypothetical protein